MREDIHQAWVLCPLTRQLVGNRTRHASHLTCPAIMTDIKLVRGSGSVGRKGVALVLILGLVVRTRSICTAY